MDSLSLAVPVSTSTDGAGRCQERMLGEDIHRIMIWPESKGPKRKVMATYRPTGQPVTYTDVRGANIAIPHMRDDAPGTSISLTFRTRLAMVENQRSNRDRQVAAVDFDEALHAEVLDQPAARVEELWRVCRQDERPEAGQHVQWGRTPRRLSLEGAVMGDMVCGNGPLSDMPWGQAEGS